MKPEHRVRNAFAALQAGHFAAARDLADPIRTTPSGAVLHALATAGAGEVEAGAAALARVARANPTTRHPVLDLSDLLQQAGRGQDAIPHLRAALAHGRHEPALLAALAAGLAETGPMDEAVALFQRLAEAPAASADAQANLGKALAATGRFAEAEAAFGRVPPGDPQRDLNRAVARLKSGELAAGWPLFRARHALPGRYRPQGAELCALDDAVGRCVLLRHDEGFGDTLQFIRYAPLLQDRGVHLRVLAPQPLLRLLRGNGLDAADRAPPGIDLWCRIPDLPGVFGTTLETIPATLPYLEADPALVEAWRTRLPPGHRVGLVWAGAARAGNAAAMATDRIRSIPRERLGPLLATPGVTWISLQHGLPPPPGVFDPMPGVADFADTAAIVASLDLVVSVDTAVVHLAGAMNRPVLLLDRFDSCWRWLHGREDSPWYPGAVRIVRQDLPGDWTGVLARTAAMVAMPAQRPGRS